MGFLSSLTGKAQAKAAAEARGFLVDSRNQSIDNLRSLSGTARNDVTAGFNNAGQSFQTARDDIQGHSGAAIDRLGDIGGRFSGGTNLYLDSLGINGREGNQRAVNAFQSGPGFNFALERGLDSISRRRAAQGLNNSGNADQDAQIFGQGLANQEFGNFQNRLSQFAPLELAAQQGTAGVEERQGTTLANLAGNQANLQARQGLSLAEIATGLGRDTANVLTAHAQPIAGQHNRAAAARGAGAANLVNLGLNAGKMLAGI